MVMIRVDASTPYDVTIERGDAWLDRVQAFSGSTVWVVTDETVDRLHGNTFRERLAHVHQDIVWSVVPPGDESKSLSVIERLVSEGLKSGCDRDTIVLAFGGGMVGDLVGFLASVYMRGVRYIQVPTTILAHDSAVGGKVAVNHPLAKNAIGAFYQPMGVHYDVTRLETLQQRDVRSGLGELIKHAYLSEHVLEASFEDALFDALTGPIDWTEWLARGIEVKRRIVEADEREAGVRAWLNFGHTFGHALEAETGFSDRLLHGEGVALGMVLAARFSARQGLMHGQDAERVAAHIGAVGLPASLAALDLACDGRRLADHMLHDKKMDAGTLPFLLLRGIGETFLAKDVNLGDVAAFLDEELARG